MHNHLLAAGKVAIVVNNMTGKGACRRTASKQTLPACEAAASQYGAYQAKGAFNPFLAALIDTRITDEVHMNFYFRHRWLASSIQGSPIVGRTGMDTTFTALAYRFK